MNANKTAEMTPLAERWLRDFNEAPWRRYILSLTERGLLADVDGIMVDAGTIFKTRFRCDTRTCAGVDRGSGVESCCTDYEVPIASIKPLACVLFPLVIYRFENGDTLLTATSRETGPLFGREKDTELPCLKMEQGDPMYVECRTAIEAGFGEAFYQSLVTAAKEFAQAKTPSP